MRLSDLHESQDVSLLGKAIYTLFNKGASIFLDFKYKANEANRGYFPMTDCHGSVSNVKKHDEGNYTVEFMGFDRNSDELFPGATFEIDSSMDDLLTVEKDTNPIHVRTVYNVVRINPLEEAVAEQPTLIWTAIKHALNKDGAFVEIDVPKSLWKKLSPTYKPSGFAANGKLRARVIGALKGNRINTKDPVLQLQLTPEMDDELEFVKLYSDEPSYMIRPL